MIPCSYDFVELSHTRVVSLLPDGPSPKFRPVLRRQVKDSRAEPGRAGIYSSCIGLPHPTHLPPGGISSPAYRLHRSAPSPLCLDPNSRPGSLPFRAYVTGKLGFVNFSVSDQNAASGFVGFVRDRGHPLSLCIPAPGWRDFGIPSDCALRPAMRSILITERIIT
jgi:hypothetical protein